MRQWLLEFGSCSSNNVFSEAWVNAVCEPLATWESQHLMRDGAMREALRGAELPFLVALGEETIAILASQSLSRFCFPTGLRTYVIYLRLT